MGEGMNEHGLTVSALSFNSQGAYEAPGSGKPALACVDVVPYLLGSATTAAEAVARLRGVAVVDDAHLTPLVGRFHWAVQDAAGAMVVLEYVGGALHVHDAARVGVLTNDPEYEWHLKNLNQYALYSLDRVHLSGNQNFTARSSRIAASISTPSTRRLLDIWRSVAGSSPLDGTSAAIRHTG